MKPDADELRFWGKVIAIAEDEFNASFHDDHDDALMRHIYAHFLEDRPKNAKAWIRGQIGKLFRCVDARPEWIEEGATWPFVDGKPAIFIRQFSLEQNDVTENLLSPGATLYVFGGRLKTSEGWEMIYSVVEQHAGSPFERETGF